MVAASQGVVLLGILFRKQHPVLRPPVKAELLDHRKFLRLVRLMNEPTPHVLGYLMLMWRRGYQTGSPALGDELDVEAAAEFRGEPGKFAKAALAAGFIDRTPNGDFEIHDLWDHAPDYVKKRMARGGNLPDGLNDYCGISPRKNRRAASKTADLTPRGVENGQTDAARRTEKRGREEREEEREKEEEKSCTEPPKPAASVPDPPAAPLLTFPTVGTGAKEWHLTQPKIDEWAETFPGVDVLAECRKARQWCIDNPPRRKTANGMTSFLSKWLGKAQNSAPRPAHGVPERRVPRPDRGDSAAGVGRVVAPAGEYAAAEARHIRVGGSDPGQTPAADSAGEAPHGGDGQPRSPPADRGGVPR
jgi:hypothetical protein